MYIYQKKLKKKMKKKGIYTKDAKFFMIKIFVNIQFITVNNAMISPVYV